MTEEQRLTARVRLLSALSEALHRAQADGLDPFDDVAEVLAMARRSLNDLDSELRRELALKVDLASRPGTTGR